MMDFEASDNPKFCGGGGGGDDGREPVSQISNLRRCSSRRDSDTATLPVKRRFNNINSFHISVKKSKVSQYYVHDKDEDGIPSSSRIRRSRKSAGKSFYLLKKEFARVEKSVKECKRMRQVEEKRLQCIKREIDECLKELVNKKTQVSCVRRINEIHDKVLGKIAECNLELKSKEKELDVMKILVGRQAEILESERKKLLKVISIRQSDPRAQMKDFESMQKQFEGQVKELESKEKQVERRAMEVDSKEIQLEGRENEFEAKQEKFEGEEKELVSKQKHFENRLMELESKENQHVGRVKEFESKKNEFEVQLRELAKELVSKQKQLQVRVKEHELKANELEHRVKELESKKKHFESQVEDFKSKDKQFEEQCKKFESKENRFKAKVKALKLKEKQIQGQVKELESKLNKFDGQVKEPEFKGKQYESVASYMDDQLSPTINGESLLLDTSEKTDGVESLCNDIFVYLLASSDPSRLVLDIIQNSIAPLCKKGDNVVIIDDSHIYLLEELMRISPNIEPCVREEALKLALDLKAYMKENTGNSLAVLGFLLLLSIYGLLTSFDEDEVLELFAFVAQHKIAMEMFRTLGFANKVSDFVENLIKRKQFVVAVRFSCAYNLADKNQLIDMLREHVQNAKLICESSCKKTNSIEIKDKARDQEIASLGTVLQCISDNSLEYEDLLSKEIQYRIFELNAHRGK